MGKPKKDRRSKEKRARKRDRMERVLKILGYWDLVERLPPKLLSLMTVYGPQFSLKVEAGDGMTGHEEIVKAARKIAEEATLIGEPFDSVRLLETLEVVFRMLTIFGAYGPEKLATMPTKYVEPIETLKEALTVNALQTLMTGLSLMISRSLNPYSRCTETMFWSSIAHGVTGKTMIYTVHIHGAKPDSREVVLEGKKRTVWRCGCWITADSSFEWVSWPEGNLPGADGAEGHMLPVYIQDHALRHLRERMNLKTKHSVGVGHNWLGWSLRNPVILPASENRYLVEFKYAGKTAGYFVAKKKGDCIVITTFLFLTMMGTPQAEKLHERLGIGRKTIDYLHLDQLKTFCNPDIRNDEELVAIFTECDCGHLFEIAQLDPEDTEFFPDQAALCRRVLFPENAVVEKQQAENDPVLSQMLEAMLYREKH